jgi:hypothetical protein
MTYHAFYSLKCLICSPSSPSVSDRDTINSHLSCHAPPPPQPTHLSSLGTGIENATCRRHQTPPEFRACCQNSLDSTAARSRSFPVATVVAFTATTASTLAVASHDWFQLPWYHLKIGSIVGRPCPCSGGQGVWRIAELALILDTC